MKAQEKKKQQLPIFNSKSFFFIKKEIFKNNGRYKKQKLKT